MTQLHLIIKSVKSQVNKVMKYKNDYVDKRNGFIEFTLVVYVAPVISIMTGEVCLLQSPYD